MIEYQLTPSLSEAVVQLQAMTLPEYQWLLGGSCGLMLQGVSLAQDPQDIDIYADTDDTIHLQQDWKRWSIDQPEWNETSTYRSLLSHYRIEDSTIELVGSFQVRTSWCSYHTKIQQGLRDYAPAWTHEGQQVMLMPLAHELVFNLLRERDDRIGAIVERMEAEPDQHRSSLQFVLSCCEPASAMSLRLKHLVPSCMRGIE